MIAVSIHTTVCLKKYNAATLRITTFSLLSWHYSLPNYKCKLCCFSFFSGCHGTWQYLRLQCYLQLTDTHPCSANFCLSLGTVKPVAISQDESCSRLIFQPALNFMNMKSSCVCITGKQSFQIREENQSWKWLDDSKERRVVKWNWTFHLPLNTHGNTF